MGACYLRGWAAEKVKDGKLVRARVEHDGVRLTSVRISGDFYLYPEEGLSELERALEGAKLSDDEPALADRVQWAAHEHGLQLVGLTPQAVARVVLEAARGAREEVPR
jgi:lipoate-protein ligase A